MADSAKQFGLIIPKKNQISAPKSVNVFGDDSNSDEDSGMDWVKKSLKAESEKNKIKKQARLDAERALEEDPTIYQYDEIYSKIHPDPKEKKLEKEKEAPKYIHTLLKNSERRKKEQEIRIERMVQKEREAEGEMFKDKEKFVTASYKAHLEKLKELQEEEREMERLESIGDVTKQADVSGFYRHLYEQTFEGGKSTSKNGHINEETDTLQKSGLRNKQDSGEKSKGTDLDRDDSSCKDEEEVKVQKVTQIVPKNRKGKQYRKRKLEVSGSESEEEKCEENTNFEITDQNIDRAEVQVDDAKKFSLALVNEGEVEPEKEKVVETDVRVKNESKREEKAENPRPKKAERNVSIWVKRTVGPVFEEAIQRYYARKAKRLSSI